MSSKNTAELFIECLEAEGVEYVFGVPGEENAHFMIALEQSSIRFVLCRHEQGAAFMSDVYGRLTGKTSVCLGTLGPGATNLVTGVADANMDRSPMLVVTGQADLHRQHKESHQYMDVVDMFKPITKWAHALIHPNNVPEVVRRAIKLAETEKPGACHVEIADDLAGFPAEGAPIMPTRVRRPVPDDKVMDEAMELLRNARKPIILAGNGAIRKQASRQLEWLVEQTGIGVISTFMGKGAIPRSRPECLFSIGLQTRDYTWMALDESDLIIVIGYDLVEYHPNLWNKEHCDAHERKIIHIDFLPAEVDTYYPIDVEVVGDPAHALWMLNERIEKEVDHLNFELGYQREYRETMLKEFEAHAQDETEGFIRPQKALWDAREVLGPEDILLSDVGAHKMWIARYYHCDRPNTCLISNGFCSMGFALPGAIAAKLIYPQRNVLAVCGDGGFLMNVQELETARRMNANIVVMVWEDGGYGLISWKQETQFGHHTNLSFNNPDLVKLAEAFDCVGMRVDNARELAPALEKAFSMDRPVVIAIPIDYRENPLLTRRLGAIECTL